jgi:hypothetical protein
MVLNLVLFSSTRVLQLHANHAAIANLLRKEENRTQELLLLLLLLLNVFKFVTCTSVRVLLPHQCKLSLFTRKIVPVYAQNAHKLIKYKSCLYSDIA